MKPPSYIALFALISLGACIGAFHYVEAVPGRALVIGAVIGAAIRLATAMSYVKRYSTKGLPPPRTLWKRIVFYAIGAPVAWVLSDKLPHVPGVGEFVRTGGWVVFLVMGATASVGVGIWWRFAGALQAPASAALDVPRPVSELDLRVVHPRIDPSRVSRALGLALFRGWRAGETRTSANGYEIGGIRKESYCCFTLEEPSSAGRAALIKKWNRRLLSKRRYLADCGLPAAYSNIICGGTAPVGRRVPATSSAANSLRMWAKLSLGISIEVLHK